jgi:hypothetical protein
MLSPFHWPPPGPCQSHPIFTLRPPCISGLKPSQAKSRQCMAGTSFRSGITTKDTGVCSIISLPRCFPRSGGIGGDDRSVWPVVWDKMAGIRWVISDPMKCVAWLGFCTRYEFIWHVKPFDTKLSSAVTGNSVRTIGHVLLESSRNHPFVWQRDVARTLANQFRNCQNHYTVIITIVNFCSNS